MAPFSSLHSWFLVPERSGLGGGGSLPVAETELVPSDPHHVLWDMARSLTCCVTLGQSLTSLAFIFLGEKGLIIMRSPTLCQDSEAPKQTRTWPFRRYSGTWVLARAVWPQTSHPTCPERVWHVCEAGMTHTDPLFVSVAIYSLPASKKDRRQLVIRCCENRRRKSKTRRKEEEEANRPPHRPT